MLCIDYHQDILTGILRLLDKSQEESETVEFDEFLCGIKTILIFDNYFEEMEQLFKYLDQSKLGKIKKEVTNINYDFNTGIDKFFEKVESAKNRIKSAKC